jgi:HPt (histidine-containing phosphotransfer) domain-containing protein
MQAIDWGQTEGVAQVARPTELEAVCDVAALCDRCMNDKGLALNLLERFGTRLDGTVQEIGRLLAEERTADTLKKVHTLKGEAGSLAAIGVQAAATDLEKCLRAGERERVDRCRSALYAAAEEFGRSFRRLLECLA